MPEGQGLLILTNESFLLPWEVPVGYESEQVLHSLHRH